MTYSSWTEAANRAQELANSLRTVMHVNEFSDHKTFTVSRRRRADAFFSWPRYPETPLGEGMTLSEIERIPEDLRPNPFWHDHAHMGADVTKDVMAFFSEKLEMNAEGTWSESTRRTEYVILVHKPSGRQFKFDFNTREVAL